MVTLQVSCSNMTYFHSHYHVSLRCSDIIVSFAICYYMFLAMLLQDEFIILLHLLLDATTYSLQRYYKTIEWSDSEGVVIQCYFTTIGFYCMFLATLLWDWCFIWSDFRSIVFPCYCTTIGCYCMFVATLIRDGDFRSILVGVRGASNRGGVRVVGGMGKWVV